MSSFKTKRGTCSLTSDELRIEESYRGQLKRYYEGVTTTKRSIVLGLLMFGGMAVAFIDIIRTDQWVLFYIMGLGIPLVLIGYGIDYVRGFRRVETIPRDAITEITSIDGTIWTHQRFIVTYETEGRMSKRRIRLPSRQFAFTDQEFERAKQLFRTNDLPFMDQ